MLVRHEGLRLKPYTDTVGKLTIGVGRNLDDVGISEAEAMLLLSNDISIARTDAEKFVWFHKLDSVRQDVIIDMIFNLGLPRFLGFKNMLHAVEMANWEEVVAQMLDSKWAKQVGKRADELAQMMLIGEYKKEP
jgi:lysozyme